MQMLCTYEVTGGQCGKLSMYLAIEPRNMLEFEPNQRIGERQTRYEWLCEHHLGVFRETHPTWNFSKEDPHACILCDHHLNDGEYDVFNEEDGDGGLFGVRCTNRAACRERYLAQPEADEDGATWDMFSQAWDQDISDAFAAGDSDF